MAGARLYAATGPQQCDLLREWVAFCSSSRPPAQATVLRGRGFVERRFLGMADSARARCAGGPGRPNAAAAAPTAPSSAVSGTADIASVHVVQPDADTPSETRGRTYAQTSNVPPALLRVWIESPAVGPGHGFFRCAKQLHAHSAFLQLSRRLKGARGYSLATRNV